MGFARPGKEDSGRAGRIEGRGAGVSRLIVSKSQEYFPKEKETEKGKEKKEGQKTDGWWRYFPVG